jgi:hypothetical protein
VASGAHTALGYGTGVPGWAAYCAAEFGELLNVLPTADQLQAMAAAGMPQRALAAPFGVSLGTVNTRLQALRAAAPAAGAPAQDARPTYAIVADAVAAAGAKGLTIPQAQRRLGWTYGATSGALSRRRAPRGWCSGRRTCPSAPATARTWSPTERHRPPPRPTQQRGPAPPRGCRASLLSPWGGSDAEDHPGQPAGQQEPGAELPPPGVQRRGGGGGDEATEHDGSS